MFFLCNYNACSPLSYSDAPPPPHPFPQFPLEISNPFVGKYGIFSGTTRCIILYSYGSSFFSTLISKFTLLYRILNFVRSLIKTEWKQICILYFLWVFCAEFLSKDTAQSHGQGTCKKCWRNFRTVVIYIKVMTVPYKSNEKEITTKPFRRTKLLNIGVSQTHIKGHHTRLNILINRYVTGQN